jgi:hypothetical protein
MITKLSNVYIIINTDKNIFFSAYLNTKVQFNDIDPHELEKIEKQQLIDALEIVESGDNLLEKNKLKMLMGGGFYIAESSDSDNDRKQTL